MYWFIIRRRRYKLIGSIIQSEKRPSRGTVFGPFISYADALDAGELYGFLS